MRAGVVIVGGGLAGQRCAETLRRAGYDAPITIVCAEPHRPYDRPPLSKEALLDETAEAKLAFRPAAWYAEQEIDLLLGVEARALEAARHEIVLLQGSRLPYEHLLVATGGRPRRLALLDGYENVHTLRSVADARGLRAALVPGERLLVIGAGFIGQEVAAAACLAGVRTTIVEAAPAPLHSLLGPELGRWFAELHRSSGVELHLGEEVVGVRGAGRVRGVRLSGGGTLACDHVLVGVGIEPSLDWLAGSGLPTGGVPTDRDGRTELADVFAAGDAAAVLDPVLGRHVLGSHWEAAARQGARAARAMLGLDPGASAPASFWSDLYGTRVHYVGHSALADEVSFEGDPNERVFTATFTSVGRPVAVLLAGRPQMLPQARAMLAAAAERSHA